MTVNRSRRASSAEPDRISQRRALRRAREPLLARSNGAGSLRNSRPPTTEQCTRRTQRDLVRQLQEYVFNDDQHSQPSPPAPSALYHPKGGEPIYYTNNPPTAYDITTGTVSNASSPTNIADEPPMYQPNSVMYTLPSSLMQLVRDCDCRMCVLLHYDSRADSILFLNGDVSSRVVYGYPYTASEDNQQEVTRNGYQVSLQNEGHINATISPPRPIHRSSLYSPPFPYRRDTSTNPIASGVNEPSSRTIISTSNGNMQHQRATSNAVKTGSNSIVSAGNGSIGERKRPRISIHSLLNSAPESAVRMQTPAALLFSSLSKPSPSVSTVAPASKAAAAPMAAAAAAATAPSSAAGAKTPSPASTATQSSNMIKTPSLPATASTFDATTHINEGGLKQKRKRRGNNTTTNTTQDDKKIATFHKARMNEHVIIFPVQGTIAAQQPAMERKRGRPRKNTAFISSSNDANCNKKRKHNEVGLSTQRSSSSERPEPVSQRTRSQSIKKNEARSQNTNAKGKEKAKDDEDKEDHVAFEKNVFYQF